MANPGDEKAGLEAINKLKSTDPPLFLSPDPDLSLSSRIASQYLFASLKPYSKKSPFDQLLTDGFDAEQIWQQIDIMSQPLVNALKREIRRFENDPDEILRGFGRNEENGGLKRGIKENGSVGFDEFEGLSSDDDDDDDDDDVDDVEEGNGDDMEVEDGEEEAEEEEDDDEGEGGGESGEEEEDDGDGVPEVEDDFLKIKELQNYLDREEEREFGSEEAKNKKKKKGSKKAVDEDEDDDLGEEDESEADEAGDELLMYGEDEEGEDGHDDIRYEDFFVPDKKAPKKKRKQADESDDSEMDDENDKKKKENLSTYEREREKIKEKIKEMEEANLGPKDWTMLGEVTATKRPKDSALEADLDFEHNVRPPPVITEEVTASLEDIIKKRILEGNFDDVQKAPKLQSTAPKEIKELDNNKSKKGLAEIYEEQYAQQTGLATAPTSFKDELKTEASKLFKALCLKLDALSHFHFAPKPVVEDMSVQANVPALAWKR